MSILFTPFQLSGVQLKNRFVHSATYEVMAESSGEVTERLIKRYIKLARGGVGLIIPGYLYVHEWGKSFPHQTGIHNDTMIAGLKRLVDDVHSYETAIVFQLAHGGMQTKKSLIGRVPRGPSRMKRNMVTMSKAKAMTVSEIKDVIRYFKLAAERALQTGVDGLQLHAAHGYLLNQFLSPFYNRRSDEWGGSEKNRFRLLGEIITEIKSVIPGTMPLLVKLNTNDYTPRSGITNELAVRYASWLDELGISAVEVSCGTIVYSFMNTCRGDVPVEEFLLPFPKIMRSFGRSTLGKLKGKYDLVEGYNLDAAKMIKPVLKNAALILVGGIRSVKTMTSILESDQADLLSMCRPFIREPHLVKKIQQGEMEQVSCISCNKCLAAPTNDVPVLCYVNGFPT